MDVWGYFRNHHHAETAAFAATLLCVAMTAWFAVRLPEKRPRVITAVALFALNWALLLLYYLPGPPQNEILSTFSGFALIYTGFLLLWEGQEQEAPANAKHGGWLEKLPLHLFRITVIGFGTYLVAKRTFRVEYGYGTLALAVWGTILTVLGYLFIWAGLVYLYWSSPALQRARALLGLLLVLYAGCECAYCVWYARQYWPPYHRYLLLQSRREAPDFEKLLPLDPQPDWPDSAEWTRLRRRPDWPQVRGLLSLRVEPRLPTMWLWLEYAFSVLKIGLTVLFLTFVWRPPGVAAPLSSSSRPAQSAVLQWIDRNLQSK